jgi:hypothetical protein
MSERTEMHHNGNGTKKVNSIIYAALCGCLIFIGVLLDIGYEHFNRELEEMCADIKEIQDMQRTILVGQATIAGEETFQDKRLSAVENKLGNLTEREMQLERRSAFRIESPKAEGDE